ncbi:MAG: TerB family tellurite resistance protein [Halocynthiibacter sp.]
MSIWYRIYEAIEGLQVGETLSALFDKLRSPPEKTVGFTIATIALGAKMAKADGQVTRDEVTAFREVFTIGKADEASAAKVFNLARQDVAGFEIYAQNIKDMFKDDCSVLIDLLEGLFHIALADGEYHPGEDDFLREVARIFDVSEAGFRRIRAQFVKDAKRDPYGVLGVDHDASMAEIKSQWRALVRESHPDRMIARGVPQEAIRLAETRLIAINEAYDLIVKERTS